MDAMGITAKAGLYIEEAKLFVSIGLVGRCHRAP
jgi:hypothetical protein